MGEGGFSGLVYHSEELGAHLFSDGGASKIHCGGQSLETPSEDTPSQHN